MKKIIIFLISIIIIPLLIPKQVTAKSQEFYEGEYLSNIFFQKLNSNGVSLYSQARITRKSNTHEAVYCIEPTESFNDIHVYEESNTIPNYTQAQLQEMALISHFGYGYENHTDPKWYPITQILIWEIANPSIEYYLTPTKNHRDTKLFTNEIEELRSLVNNYKKETSLNNKTYTIVEGETLIITDQNNALSNYTTKENIQIKDNTIIIENFPQGTHKITLEKEHNYYNKHTIFYAHNESQDFMDIGDPYKINETFTIKVINTELNITKTDAETNEEIPQGNASLINSSFNLYKKDNTLIKTITLNNTTESIKNLSFGEYYLTEIKPGEGYELNDKVYPFTISENTPIITLKIPNKVIKSKLVIKKEYGTEDNFLPEQSISFNIYKDNELIETIITDEQGIAEITLPYGSYKIIQLTSTEGYSKIDPIYFDVKDNKVIYYNLKDYKIDVPNTKTTTFLVKLIKFIKSLLCGKK